MRIFSAQPTFHFYRDINAALIEMGHDVVIKSDEYGMLSRSATRKEHNEYSERLNKEKPGINKRWIEEVEKAHKNKKLDLFISGTDMQITYPETIEKIKSLGIPTLNAWHDDIPDAFFIEYCQDLALVFDYNWTFQLEAIRSYKKIGANVIYTPGGANPHICKSYNCERDHDVVFMGRNKNYRRNAIKAIVDNGIDIRVWGDGWRNVEIIIGLILNNVRNSQKKISTSVDVFSSELIWHTKHFGNLSKIFGRCLSYDDMVKMYSQSKITLNFSGYPETKNVGTIDFDKSVKGLTGRDSEAPMCGAFYLTQYSDHIAQMYEIGKEIETFRSVPELIDKIKYYLENPVEAESIRKAGRERALKDYTWVKCLEKMFHEMGIS